MGKKVSESWYKDVKRTSEPIRQRRPARSYPYLATPERMARPLLKMQRRVAKGQSIRWKRDLRHLAAKEVSTALQEQRREYRARSQVHEIRSTLESFLFWLSFIFFRVVRIMSAGALEALRKELLRGTTAGQNRRTYRDLAVGRR
jgi:hypothetical protein